MNSFDLEMKHKRINYYREKGRISEEEYERWILSTDVDFEPKVMSAEEVAQKFKATWNLDQLNNQPLMWVADSEGKTHKLLEEISKTLIRIEEKLNRTL